jgi:hypothetical protein
MVALQVREVYPAVAKVVYREVSTGVVEVSSLIPCDQFCLVEI